MSKGSAQKLIQLANFSFALQSDLFCTEKQAWYYFFRTCTAMIQPAAMAGLLF